MSPTIQDSHNEVHNIEFPQGALQYRIPIMRSTISDSHVEINNIGILWRIPYRIPMTNPNISVFCASGRGFLSGSVPFLSAFCSFLSVFLSFWGGSPLSALVLQQKSNRHPKRFCFTEQNICYSVPHTPAPRPHPHSHPELPPASPRSDGTHQTPL